MHTTAGGSFALSVGSKVIHFTFSSRAVLARVGEMRGEQKKTDWHRRCGRQCVAAAAVVVVVVTVEEEVSGGGSCSGGKCGGWWRGWHIYSAEISRMGCTHVADAKELWLCLAALVNVETELPILRHDLQKAFGDRVNDLLELRQALDVLAVDALHTTTVANLLVAKVAVMLVDGGE
jgi:hypothetical protein